MSTTTEQRAGCILVNTWSGDVRAARGRVGRIIRQVLGRDAGRTHGVAWLGQSEVGSQSLPRFVLSTTPAEWDALMAAFADQPAGLAPVDCYSDHPCAVSDAWGCCEK